MVVGLRKDGDALVAVDSGATGSAVAAGRLKHLNLQALGASATIESITRVALADGSVFALVGLGSGALSVDEARGLGGALGRHFSDTTKIILDLPLTSANHVAATLEGAAVGNYLFEDYKGTKKGLKLKDIRHVFITHQHSDHNADYGALMLLAWAADFTGPVDTWGPPPLAAMTTASDGAPMEGPKGPPVSRPKGSSGLTKPDGRAATKALRRGGT